MIVLISEKLSDTRAFAPTAAQKWPAQQIFVLHTHRHSHIAFRYPRGLQWKDYPRTEQVSSRIRRDASWTIARVNADGTVHLVEVPDEQDAVTRMLLEASQIVYACGRDWIGAVAYSDLMGALIGHVRAVEERSVAAFADYSTDVVEKAFAESETTEGPEFRSWLSYGQTRTYFDYNFSLNSLAILGKTFERVSGGAAPTPIGKYALQTLYIVRDSTPMTVGALIHKMQSWTGTGRYPPAVHQQGIGSPVSRSRILDDLVENGLIVCKEMERGAGATVHLTARGRRFMDALHPDCEDPDLPYRLDTWCSDGLVDSGAKINTYIRTFFGKQKRFIDGR